MTSKYLALAILAAAVTSAPAAAVTTVGSAAVSLVGVSADAESVGVGTTFTNTEFAVVGSATGDFVPLTGQNLVVSSLTAEVGALFSFSSVWGDFSGTVQLADAMGGSDNRTVSAYVVGLFSPTGVLAGFTEGPASATFSFTQTGTGNAVSGSFTFASPPAGGVVPEPATWALLITGFGLVGFAVRRRRQDVGLRVPA